MIRGLLIVGFILGGEVLGQENACYTTNRFEYEHKVLEKLVFLETFIAGANERIAALERQLQDT
ncbi:hypothetical protein DPMN_189138 [Dreissena polymorpha]|uniref:Uncharacterized protein n=1 Tax=Dreissena polymorpha TaxID=45954 RepID=A0A9D4IC09_DREPO|nr:hypothetical protein DPMN_189138 [Dreissena polymorpha]